MPRIHRLSGKATDFPHLPHLLQFGTALFYAERRTELFFLKSAEIIFFWGGGRSEPLCCSTTEKEICGTQNSSLTKHVISIPFLGKQKEGIIGPKTDYQRQHMTWGSKLLCDAPHMDGRCSKSPFFTLPG